jgi:hypothetical protein
MAKVHDLSGSMERMVELAWVDADPVRFQNYMSSSSNSEVGDRAFNRGRMISQKSKRCGIEALLI